MKFINTFSEGESGSEIYLVKKKVCGTSKTGKPYESVTLGDKTGTIEGKIWDPNNDGISDYDEGDYVMVTGDITSWQGALQFNIRRLRKVSEDEYDISNYIPSSKYNIEDMFSQLLALVDSLNGPYSASFKKLLDSFFREDEKLIKDFKTHSAAKSVHHGFRGGLLEHTLSVTKNCDFFTKQYPFLDRDLLLTASMLHDIGKLQELSDFPVNDYTDEGNLLGHIVMGITMISNKLNNIPELPIAKKNELLHCIAAHHGELEYGSPKKPAIAEAIALSFADNMDAKMETIYEALINVEENNLTWQGFNRLLDSNIRRTSE